MNARALFFCAIYQVIFVKGYINANRDAPFIKLDKLLEPPIIKYPIADTTERSTISQEPQSEITPSRYPDFPSFALDANSENGNTRADNPYQDPKERNNPFSHISLKNLSRSLSSSISQDNVETSFDLYKGKNQGKQKKFLKNRSYSRTTPYENANLLKPPMLKDLSPPEAKLQETFWASLPAASLSFAGPYLMFPHLVTFMQYFIGSDPTILENITDAFGPGVSILYGTFVSLTLSILYKRQHDIQNQAAKESSLLAMTTRNMLSLFKKDQVLAIEAGQSAADQIRNLANGSRGEELMMLMYNDPYARMLELLGRKEQETIDGQGVSGDFFTHCRDNIRELYSLRATRLSDEALALPQNHFFILTSLTILILLGYTTQIVMQSTGDVIPRNDSSLVFGLLCSIYMLFYNFATDLNDPFDGIYQIRRSATASHLLQLKWLIVNHPMLHGKVDFNKFQEDEDEDIALVTPGLNKMWFHEI